MQMKTYFFLLCSITMVSACIHMGERVDGNGNMKSEKRTVSTAERMKVLGDMDVYVEKGPTSVRVEADENILPYIETSMNDGWLEIRTRDGINLNSKDPIKVYVSTPEVSGLTVAGSGTIESKDEFSTSHDMEFDISGSGDITAVIHSPRVESHISGSGNLHVSGETKDVEIHISGSGNYDGPGLKAENAEVSIAGSGDANLFADERLKASIAGSGDVRYQGNATVDSHISGSGSVTKN